VSPKSTPQEYFEVAYEPYKGGCSVTHLNDRELAWPLKTGKSVATAWPKDMTFSMNPERSKDVALTDYIPNLEGFLLASPRLTTFLREQALPGVEFLPVTILDHKKRVASKEHTIVNCYHVVDCVDQKSSDFKWDGLENPSMVVKRMALRADALGENDKLIRPKFVPGKVLYRADLREALNAQKFTGLAFTRKLFGDFKVYRQPR
jgi:hypothetical protein